MNTLVHLRVVLVFMAILTKYTKILLGTLYKAAQNILENLLKSSCLYNNIKKYTKE